MARRKATTASVQDFDTVNVETIQEINTEEVTTVKELVKNKPTPKKTIRKFEPDDEIMCRSITGGELILIGKKTGNKYVWADINDEAPVLYQDLQSLKVTRSNYIYTPLFIILDDELLNQWSDLQEVYSHLLSDNDINKLLEQSPEAISNTLQQLPKGIADNIKTILGDKVLSGELDSIRKIKAIDNALKTDFSSIVG